MPDPYEAPQSRDVHHDQAAIPSPLDKPEVTSQPSSEVKDGISTAPIQINHEEFDTAHHDKSETMAHVLKHPASELPPSGDRDELQGEHGVTLDAALGRRQERIQRNTGQEKQEVINRKNLSLIQLEAQAKEYEQAGRPVPQYVKEALDEQTATHKKAVEKIQSRIEQYPQRSLERINRSIDMMLELPSQLYDVNPDLFADMPTEEFIKAVKEFDELSWEVESVQEQLAIAIELDKSLARNIEEEKALTESVIKDWLADIWTEDEAEENLKKFDAVQEPAWEKSPKEIMTGYKGVSRQIVEELKQKLEKAKQKEEVFLTNYRPNQESSSQ